MSSSDDRDREIAELKAQVERLSAAQSTTPPKVAVTGGPSAGGGLKSGFFGCLGVVGAIFALLVVLGVVGQCSRNMPANVASNPDSAAAAAEASKSAAQALIASESSQAAVSNWIYNEEADALHDAKTKTACTTSQDQVHLSFPYHDTDAQLCVRVGPRFGADAYVQLNADGQILCGVEGCATHVRFDKGAVQTFPSWGAADNSTNIIFLHRTPALVAALKKSSSTVVELQLYQAGMQTLTFRTAGLKWP